MAKTVVDIDPDLLDHAKTELGTSTIKETVAQALALVVARGHNARREVMEWLSSDPLPDARDPEVMKDAWR
jgi:Arc/MetJ family transcription regulator